MRPAGEAPSSIAGRPPRGHQKKAAKPMLKIAVMAAILVVVFIGYSLIEILFNNAQYISALE